MSGYDGRHPKSLNERLTEEGMVFQTVASPGDRAVSLAEEGAAQQSVPTVEDEVRWVLASELVRILDRGSLQDVTPEGPGERR